MWDKYKLVFEFTTPVLETIARSDQINPGRQYEVELWVEKSKITESHLKELLSDGQFSGLLQWQNGGYGRFAVVSLTKQ